MNPNDSTTDRMRGVGIAVPDEATLEERARELARIDGRREPNEMDFEQARNDLLTIGSMPSAPEAGELENLTTWDTPLTASGGPAAESALDDEVNIAEKLVEEGVEEADHETRLMASEKMDEEEL